MKYRPRRDMSGVTARVIHEDGESALTVRNATANGVQLDGYLQVESGDPLRIAIRDRVFGGHVVWARKEAFGVAFDTALSEQDLTLFTGKFGASARRKPGRVGFMV